MRKTLVLVCIALGGCMVGPNYKAPEISMPEKFNENEEGTGCTDEELCRWWRRFNDPLLNAFIEEAALDNFDVRIALEKIVEARAQYRIERSYLFPEIDLNAAATRSRFSQNIFTSSLFENSLASGNAISPTTETGGIFGLPVQNFFQLGFDAIWELDFWGKFRRGKQAAFDLWQASVFDAQTVLITTISEIARNYVSIRSLQLQIELLKKQIVIDKRELQLNQVLLDAGLDSEIEVDTLITQLEEDLAFLPQLEASLKTTIYAFAVLLGKQPEQLGNAFETIEKIPSGLGWVPAGLPSDLLRRRPDVRSAERQLASATENIGIAVADLFPHIYLTGNGYGYESSHTNNLFSAASKYWTIGPIINWDLIDFGRTRAQIASANSVQRQMLLAYEQTVINSLKDVEGALVAYFEEENRNRHLSKELTAERRILELTEDLFTSGLVSELNVLQIEKTVLTQEMTLIQSDAALTSDLIALYKALGGNWECMPSP